MTTSASVSPAGDVPMAAMQPRSGSRDDAPARRSSVTGVDVARAQASTMQSAAVAKAIDAMPTTGERESRRTRQTRPDRVPDSTRKPPTDEPSARARAAEADLRVRQAAYQGVSQVIENTGNSSALKAAEEKEAAEETRGRDRSLDHRSARAAAREAGERRAELIAEDQARADEAAVQQRLEQVRDGLARLSEDARRAAADEVRLINEAAEAVARENTRRHTAGAMRSGTLSPTDVSPEVARALATLAERAGAVPAIKGDRTILVQIGSHTLVDRRGVHPIELREITLEPAASRGGSDAGGTPEAAPAPDVDSGPAPAVGSADTPRPSAPPRDDAPAQAPAPTDPRGTGRAVVRLEALTDAGRPLPDLSGVVNGLIDTVNSTIPQVARVVDNITTVAHADAALAGRVPTEPTTASSSADVPTATVPAAGSTSVVAPTAGDLLDELADNVHRLAVETARQRDVASAVSAIRQGPPASFYAAVVARAGEPGTGMGPTEIAASCAQRLVSDLQVVAAASQAATQVADGVASTAPFVPLLVASSEPGLMRLNTAEPQVWVEPGTSVPTGPRDEGLAGGSWPNLDVLTEPLSLDLQVLSVARGHMVMSRAGVPGGTDISQGRDIALAVGIQPTDEADASDLAAAELVLSPPVTIEGLAEGVNVAAAQAGLDVQASARTASDGLAHLVLESADGMGWVAKPHGDGTGADILGGFSLLAPRTQTFVMSTSPGLPWSAVSDSATVDGPIPGLTLSLAPEAAGQQVTLQASPQMSALADDVEGLVGAVGGVLDAVHEGAQVAVPALPGATEGEPGELAGVPATGAGDADGAPEAAAGETGDGPAAAGTPEAAVARQSGAAARAAAAYGVELPGAGTAGGTGRTPGGFGTAPTPGAQGVPSGTGDGADSAGKAGAPLAAGASGEAVAAGVAGSGTTPSGASGDTAGASGVASGARPAPSREGTTPAVDLPVRAVAEPTGPSPLAEDREVSELVASLAAAISGVGATGETANLAATGAGAALAGIGGVPMIPGVMIELDSTGRRRVAFDKEAFAAALREDSTGTRASVRAAATEVAATTREPLDGRLGMLAVRMDQEIDAARRGDVKAASPDWGEEQRDQLLERRADALAALLVNLQLEDEWLRAQASHL